ncbi:hypothetical protein P691DRAFT_241096 [Macrolepiota fuliginosa MF-IS2]|uniref:Uncharacterized protein n=1 Tax=Macrolepiota fuliginosa MF-IS2 TaxID=1400762 RepID=A0A9P5X7C4_9AGAR|nr:hypothetical protein P691DRAFT_241096 [Macrolepiota fuliginosa MF-IS2]
MSPSLVERLLRWRRLLLVVLSPLRQIQPRGVGLLQRVYSALLRLLGLHWGRAGSRTTLQPDLGSPLIAPISEATLCYSTLPSNHGEVGIGSIPPGSLNTIESISGSESATSEVPGLAWTIDNLYPVSRLESERYLRNVKIAKGPPGGLVIPPCSTIDNLSPNVPPPWTRYVHPEGAVYFWDSRRRIVTDAYILHSHVYSELEDVLSRIQDYMTKFDITYPSKETVHLYLEHYPGIAGFGYYFVDHAKRMLFWLDKMDAYEMTRELQTPSPRLELIGMELRSQYWHHNEHFPNTFNYMQPPLTELQDILWHANGDILTSSKSTIPYTLEEVRNMRELVADIITHHEAYGNLDAGARTVTFRLLGLIIHERFLNFHGEEHARLCSDRSVFEEPDRTWFISVVSPLVFFASEDHLSKLQSVPNDSFVKKSSWEQLLMNLTRDWEQYTLYATVLLTSNVSFLAIQSLDALGTKGYRNSAQRASYFSTAVSIGAIALGLLLVRQHHATPRPCFLVDRSVTALGLEMLAVLYSLPYALLVYGMITFFLAFSIMCFQSDDKATMGILGFSWALIVLLLGWCISMLSGYTTDEMHWIIQTKYEALKKAVGVRSANLNPGREATSGVAVDRTGTV